MNKNFNYKEKKKNELEWWKSNHSQTSAKGLIKSVFHSRLFWDWERTLYSYDYGKQRMTLFLNKFVDKKRDRLLLAPVGDGSDYKYVKRFSEEIYGIDLSPRAVELCKKRSDGKINVKVGDILHSGYPDKFFDIIISTFFFHHIVSLGFNPFLKEFYRILKQQGILVILDFSILYPLNAFTRPLKKLFRNPYGEVESERPFRPKLMIQSLKQVGFFKIQLSGANFSHCSIPVPIAKIINKLTRFLLENEIFKRFSWIVLFGAIK